jgi:hypothetical protein
MYYSQLDPNSINIPIPEKRCCNRLITGSVILLLFLLVLIEGTRLYFTLYSASGFEKAGNHISETLDKLEKQDKEQYELTIEFVLPFANQLMVQLQNLTNCACRS